MGGLVAAAIVTILVASGCTQAPTIPEPTASPTVTSTVTPPPAPPFPFVINGVSITTVYNVAKPLVGVDFTLRAVRQNERVSCPSGNDVTGDFDVLFYCQGGGFVAIPESATNGGDDWKDLPSVAVEYQLAKAFALVRPELNPPAKSQCGAGFIVSRLPNFTTADAHTLLTFITSKWGATEAAFATAGITAGSDKSAQLLVCAG